ncbi:MAG: hypothetical protein HY901_16445, partial [Deltaproteobacteria bacterium]|nr:hypothetical protein [Deltaproteobacteria bacterium]
MATALLCGTIALAGPCPSITGARADTCYPGGPLPPNYTLNGDATFSGTHLVITPDLQDQNASVMLNPVFSTAGDLHVKLVLRITTSTGAGADGMALVLHSDPRGVAAIGQPGRGMGYGLQNSPTPMITPSVVVEFDTHRNNELGDPSDNHVAITLDGNPDHDAFPSSYRQNLGSGLTLKSNAPVYVWLDYASASHGLSLYLSSTDTKPTASTLGVSGIDLAARLGASLWLGFTGSTGGAQSKHEVLEFYASDTLVAPDSTCCSADAQCTSSPQGPVCDLRKHVCGECTEADTSHCPSQAPACDEMNGRCVACLVDADCLADHWCHHEACLPRLAHGELLPGSCATLGARACRSGVCEASDDRCGFLNAPSSTGDCAGDPARCRSGRCDVDGHCGLANGHGPCSAASGATDCRSAVCDEAAALCGNPRGAGCGSAAECSTLLCADAVCCDAACEESCDACDLPGSTGTCTPASARAPGAPTCAPFACDGVTTRCPTECATDSACPDGRYCDASHQCLPQKAVGLACASAHECSGGNCVD